MEMFLAVVVTALIFGGIGFIFGVILMGLSEDKKIGRKDK